MGIKTEIIEYDDPSLVAAKEMLKKNKDFVIHVNLSYSQLEKPDFVDMVAKLLKDLDFPGEHLCLEITERCRLLDLELLKNVAVNLEAMGILVALDDFGTGFSSIGILKEIPINITKIDRSFILKIEESEKDRELIRNFAGFIHGFNSKICVEGVETKGMIDNLRKINVDSFQGYYYGKPLPLDQLLTWKKK